MQGIAHSSSAAGQSTALRQVNSAVNQMDQVTRQNASMVEEAMAASAALSSEADMLKSLVARFRVSSPASPSGHGH